MRLDATPPLLLTDFWLLADADNNSICSSSALASREGIARASAPAVTATDTGTLCSLDNSNESSRVRSSRCSRLVRDRSTYCSSRRSRPPARLTRPSRMQAAPPATSSSAAHATAPSRSLLSAFVSQTATETRSDSHCRWSALPSVTAVAVVCAEEEGAAARSVDERVAASIASSSAPHSHSASVLPLAE